VVEEGGLALFFVVAGLVPAIHDFT